MKNPIPQQLNLGDLQTHEGLALLPVYCAESIRPLDYLTLDEAVAENLIRITEVNEGGSVPELLLENLADRPVLLVDGEELIGAKQNRVLNLSVLIQARHKTVAPVSCVESGRWRYERDNFVNSDRVHFAAGRSKKMASVSKSMHQQGHRRSDQGEVWSEIEMKFSRMKTSSPTSAMADLYETVDSDLEEYLIAFEAAPEQNGAFFFVHGKLVGFDLFDQASTWARLFKKLLRSYAIDAIEKPVSEQNGIDTDEARNLISQLRVDQWRTYPAIGMGTDYRFSSPQAAGAGLIVDEVSIHLSGFVLNDNAARDVFEGRMSSARARRHMRGH